MELILEHAPSIEWEAGYRLDRAKAEADPLDWIKPDIGSRMTTAHVKDIAPDGDCAKMKTVGPMWAKALWIGLR